MENSVIKAIETRRSVRSFSQKAIPEELLDAVLKAGTYAPTGGGRQSPVIVAVKDAAYRDKIARLNAEVMGKDTDPYYGAPVIRNPARGGRARSRLSRGGPFQGGRKKSRLYRKNLISGGCVRGSDIHERKAGFAACFENGPADGYIHARQFAL